MTTATATKKTTKVLATGGPFDDSIWNHYRVTWRFVGKLCGSTPFRKDMMEGWLNSRTPSVRPPGGKSTLEIAEEVINRLPDMGEENKELEERKTLVFQQVDRFYAIPANNIRAHLKDCTSQVQNQLVGKIKGERNFTTRVKNGLYVKGDTMDEAGTDVVFISKNGDKISQDKVNFDLNKVMPDRINFMEKTVHASSPQGPISAIKRFAYIVQPEMTFIVSLLGNSVKLDDLVLVLKYGATHGFGGERSAGEGKYVFEITEA